MILGTLFSGIMAGVQRKRATAAQNEAKSTLESAEGKMDNLFNSEYYTDILDRTDSQAIVKSIRDNQQQQNKTNSMYSAIAGSTGESQAAFRNQTGQDAANAYGNIVANASQWKSNMYNNYTSNKTAYANANAAIDQSAAQGYRTSAFNNLQSTTGGLQQIDSSISNIVEGLFGK